MSAYFCENDVFCALATYWWEAQNPADRNTALERCVSLHLSATDPDHLKNGYQSFFVRVNRITAELLDANDNSIVKTVYAILRQQNITSLQARYPSDWKEMIDDGLNYHRSNAVARALLNRRTSFLVDILRGYEYQSCEDEGWRTSLAYFICSSIRDLLLKDFVACCPVPESLQGWGSWTEPASSEPADVAYGHDHQQSTAMNEASIARQAAAYASLALKAFDLKHHFEGTWREHPQYTVQDWCGQVAEDARRLGYWEWVANSLDNEESEDSE